MPTNDAEQCRTDAFFGRINGVADGTFVEHRLPGACIPLGMSCGYRRHISNEATMMGAAGTDFMRMYS